MTPRASEDPFLGILLLDGEMAQEPGCIATAASFPYPVVHRTVAGARAPGTRAEAEALLPAYARTARELEAEGAAAITDNCNGLFALVQEPLADAVGVPVATSSLLMVPAIARTVPGRRIGVLTFFEDAVGEDLYRACGWSSEEIPVAAAGVGESRAWREFLDTKQAPPERLAAMEDDLVAVARGLAERHPDVGAFVCECTLLPPASQSVRRRLGLPVFDLLNLVDLLMAGHRRPADLSGASA